MKKVLTLVVVSLVILASPMRSFGQQRDIKSILKREIVKTENGMYSIQEYGTATAFTKDFNVKNFQVSISAKAPVSLLSKENFARFYGALSVSILTSFFSQEGLKAPDDFHILLKDKPGNPIDITIEIVMSDSGIDYTMTTPDGNSKMNLHWLTQLYQEVER
jgi:putative cell wall-binding protein